MIDELLVSIHGGASAKLDRSRNRRGVSRVLPRARPPRSASVTISTERYRTASSCRAEYRKRPCRVGIDLFRPHGPAARQAEWCVDIPSPRATVRSILL